MTRDKDPDMGDTNRQSPPYGATKADIFLWTSYYRQNHADVLCESIRFPGGTGERLGQTNLRTRNITTRTNLV